jgi:hypothetical protein
LTITLTAADQFGVQIPTVQSYNGTPRVTYGILDTGASPITFSAADQAFFTSEGAPIPILAAGGAQAGGIGGSVTGDVSEPGTIYVDGMHALSAFYDNFGFPQYAVNFTGRIPGIQAFVGNTSGSPTLHTVTGTAIFDPSAVNPEGLAALVNFLTTTPAPGSSTGPDVHFVSPATTLSAGTGTTSVVSIPLSLFGPDNYTSPGDQVTVAPVPVDPAVSAKANGLTTHSEEFLFDTGSQLTIISPAMARSLNLNLSHPTRSMQIEGVGGVVTVPGFTLHSLSVGGSLTFDNVPVYVLNIGSNFDGVLGMNLFNRAASMLYNPYGQGGASLSVNFLTGSTPSLAGRNTSPPLNQFYLNTLPGQLRQPPPPAQHLPQQRHSLMIIASPDAAPRTNLPAPPGLQSGSYLLITLQAPSASAAQPVFNSPTPAGGAAFATASSIGHAPGYGAIYFPEASDTSRPDTSRSTSQPDSTTRSEVAPSPAAPEDMQPSASESAPEAVSAFFSASEERILDEEEAARAWSENPASDALAKLAIVVAGFWGSVPRQENRRARQPVKRSA